MPISKEHQQVQIISPGRGGDNNCQSSSGRNKRDFKVVVALNLEEYTLLQERAQRAQTNMAAILRSAGMAAVLGKGKFELKNLVPPADPQLISELSSVGMMLSWLSRDLCQLVRVGGAGANWFRIERDVHLIFSMLDQLVRATVSCS